MNNMKTSIALLAYNLIPLAALTALTALAAPVPPSAVTAPTPITHVYSPLGFDSNDNAEVIIRGYLPSLCYRAPNAHSQVNGETIDIQVGALLATKGTMCAQIVVPFLESAQVGALPAGNYGIMVNPSEPDFLASSIFIAAAPTTTIDNAVYANVTSVERTPGTRSVTLKGLNPVSCYDLDQIKYISNGKDTYTVMPIMKQVNTNCEKMPTPFAYTWDVPTDLGAKEPMPLLHVRVMNGKSINTLFDESQ
jgi:hypothetical protein